MANTIFKLGGLLPNDAKLTAPIFTTPGKPFRASVNISATGDHTKNVSITTVYWDDGKKITVSVRENIKERCITVFWE